MASDIRSRLNADYVKDCNKFRKRDVIQVYVEGFLDKSFWYFFLQPYEQAHKCEFRISILRDRDRTLCGKDSVLAYKKEKDLGRNLWLCVDSDYDELIKNYGAYSDLIKRSKYIITTWWYSIENLKCAPLLLRDDVIKASLPDKFGVDFIAVMGEISKLYKGIFFLLLEMKEKHDDRFQIDEFSACLSKISFKNGELDKESVQSAINVWTQNHADWFEQYKTEAGKWKKKLEKMGFGEDEYYQLYNGHGLYEHIAVPMVEHYAKKLRSAQLNTIANGADSKERKEQLVNEYNNKTKMVQGTIPLKERVKQLITDNIPLMDCSAAQKIKSQIEAALA